MVGQPGACAIDAARGLSSLRAAAGRVWSQQGAKLVGTPALGENRQGNSVSLSGDGNSVIVGGYLDNNSVAPPGCGRALAGYGANKRRSSAQVPQGMQSRGLLSLLPETGIPPLWAVLWMTIRSAPRGYSPNLRSPARPGKRIVTARASRRWPSGTAGSIRLPQRWGFRVSGRCKTPSSRFAGDSRSRADQRWTGLR
jgi:hypothetical protein